MMGSNKDSRAYLGYADKVDIMGVAFHRITLDAAAEMASAARDEGRSFIICTPNPEIVEKARRDDDLASSLAGADLVVPDGIGVILASRILGKPLLERVAGIDLARRLLEVASQKHWRVFLLGTDAKTVAKAGETLRKELPGISWIGWHHGYFSKEEEEEVSDLIKRARPDLVLVGMGSPRQERWARDYGRSLGACIVLTVGGSLDVFAGKARRAPGLVRKMGIEWLYRLLMDPKRAGRQVQLFVFGIRVLGERLRMMVRRG
ncbi:MAG TPA: WecB/TagA/CpsF family glycosyltransferase [Clostridia bacterium]|nr:WecB/TagA/CpsF family glycosyltransferase [Clostridia bacterium]